MPLGLRCERFREVGVLRPHALHGAHEIIGIAGDHLDAAGPGTRRVGGELCRNRLDTVRAGRGILRQGIGQCRKAGRHSVSGHHGERVAGRDGIAQGALIRLQSRFEAPAGFERRRRLLLDACQFGLCTSPQHHGGTECRQKRDGGHHGQGENLRPEAQELEHGVVTIIGLNALRVGGAVLIWRWYRRTGEGA